MHDVSDAELLLESLGSPERFEVVFERHYHHIRRYTQRRVGMEAGEDLAAQTFATAFSSRSTFDGRSDSARAWLFGIANNLVRHHLRSESHRWAAWVKLPSEAVDDGEIDAARLDAVRAGPAIRSAIAALSVADRETFLLFALGELSYAEVAGVLGVPIGTVRSRIFRVRKILRELLREPEATTEGVSESRNTAEGRERP